MDNQYNENDIFETEKVEERENPVEQVKAEERRRRRRVGVGGKEKRTAEKNLRRRAQRGAVRSVASAAFYGVNKFLGGSSSSTVYHFKRLDHKDDVGGRRKS